MSANLPAGWRRVRLGDVLEQVNRFERVDPNREYRLLGVRLYAQGCHLHTTVKGQDFRGQFLSKVCAGNITYNKMWASKGAFAVVRRDQDGYFSTSEYPLFAARDGVLDEGFLAYALARRSFWHQASNLCKGTTERARLHPDDFLRLELDLPPLGDQARIATLLRAIDAAIRAACRRCTHD